MLESDFKAKFLDKLSVRMGYHGILIFIISTKPHNRSYPDTIILGPNVWVALEFKKSIKAKKQPNQLYYIQLMDQITYARFVYPENEAEVINDLERLFLS